MKKKTIYYNDYLQLPKDFNKNIVYLLDNAFSLKSNQHLISAQNILKHIYVNNIYLPEPSYKKYKKHKKIIVCHVRLGDATKRQKELKYQYRVISYFEKKYPECKIIIHTNGNVPFNETDNIIIKNNKTHVLNVLSDCINADIFILSDSSLSFAASWLCDNNTQIIGPSYDNYNSINRIRNGYITYNSVLNI